MRIAAVQMNPGSDKAHNIDQAGRLIDEALASDRIDMIALPEMWTCLGGDMATKRAAAERLPAKGSNAPGGSAYEFLRLLARQRNIFVHGGSLGEDADGTLFNTTVVFNPEGVEIARYRKIHLFDITTPDGLGYRESSTYGFGTELITFDAGELKMGCAICYDIRFPELFSGLRRLGADVIFIPSAFTVQTGRDHWEPLLRARAIETQCWFVAPATWGRHTDARGGARFTFGHSIICNPWGHIVAQCSDGPGCITASIDRKMMMKIREDMPVSEHRRLQ